MADDSLKSGTRVYKKTSSSGKITTYLGKRDFVDHLTHVDLIDGMVLIDESIIASGKQVFATLVAAFRYGREDLDVLGLQFRKDLLCCNFQIYPPDPACTYKFTRLQERLKHKLGNNAYPFWFQIPAYSPSSVTLQPAPGDTGKPCGLDYELKTYVIETLDEKPRKTNTVRLAIRKLTYAPYDNNRPQPHTEVSREFIMSSGMLHMEASLDKEMYYHGESIFVNVYIQNNSSKTVKKIKVAVVQIADICLFMTASYQCDVAKLESVEGFPISPGGTLSKVYSLCPLLANNRDKRGLALDGKLKHEDTNLASSTILSEGESKENLGIVVQYRVKIRLSVSGALGGELCGELPLILTHPKPSVSPEELAKGTEPTVDVDLIHLDPGDEENDENIVFEDFARLRLKGEENTV